MSLQEVITEVAQLLVAGNPTAAEILLRDVVDPPVEERARKVGDGLKAYIWTRDNFRCGYCTTPVIPSIALRCISGHFETLFPFQRNWKGAHSSYWTISAAVDHRDPHSRSGNQREENLATACWACNQRKGNLTEAEFGRWQRQDSHGWDGLMSIYPRLWRTLPQEAQLEIFSDWERHFTNAAVHLKA